jgi:hypothetical protein
MVNVITITLICNKSYNIDIFRINPRLSQFSADQARTNIFYVVNYLIKYFLVMYIFRILIE